LEISISKKGLGCFKNSKTTFVAHSADSSGFLLLLKKEWEQDVSRDNNIVATKNTVKRIYWQVETETNRTVLKNHCGSG
jgi:hypothetical protein